MLDETLLALDALNSWVRTPGGWESWGAGRVVYWLKREALRRAQRDRAVTHERIGLLATCRGCSGTGRYIDSSGREFDHHYECNSKGIVDLQFLKSTITLFDGRSLVWHTPQREVWQLGVVLDDLFEHREVDWLPYRVGRELPPDEAARLLNLVESRISHDSYRPRYDFELDQDVDDFGTYQLYVGEAPKLCGICGECAVLDSALCSTGRALWRAYVCPSCRKANPGSALFRLLELRSPACLEQPNIAEWMRRHPKEKTNARGFQTHGHLDDR